MFNLFLICFKDSGTLLNSAGVTSNMNSIKISNFFDNTDIQNDLFNSKVKLMRM